MRNNAGPKVSVKPLTTHNLSPSGPSPQIPILYSPISSVFLILNFNSFDKNFATSGDLNLHPPYQDTLEFDVTEDSIVSNLDLSFMMPKGGMASMIAIGENTDKTSLFSDDSNEDALRFLEMFGPDKEIFGTNDEDNPVWVSPLPLSRDKDKKEDEVKRYDYKQEKASKIIQNLNLYTDKDFKTFWIFNSLEL